MCHVLDLAKLLIRIAAILYYNIMVENKSAWLKTRKITETKRIIFNDLIVLEYFIKTIVYAMGSLKKPAVVADVYCKISRYR